VYVTVVVDSAVTDAVTTPAAMLGVPQLWGCSRGGNVSRARGSEHESGEQAPQPHESSTKE